MKCFESFNKQVDEEDKLKNEFVDNGEQEDYNFEEEDLEEDDYYYEDDK